MTLTDALLPGAGLAALLDDHNNGQPIVLTNASTTTHHNEVQVHGTAVFLNVAQAADGVFTLSAAGTPVMVLRFTVDAGRQGGRGDGGGPAVGELGGILANGPAGGGPHGGGPAPVPPWTFRTSFPDLPFFLDWRNPAGPMQTDLLGGASLAHGAFILTNAAGTDQQTQKALVPGLNIVGALRPGSLLGALAGPLGADGEVQVSGLVVAERPGATPPPSLSILTYPWDPPGDPVPGIHLRADLTADVRIGLLRLHGLCLRMYAPETTSWMKANPSYHPVIGLTATFDIPSAALSAAVTATVVPGTAELNLGAELTGFTLNRLDQLADLVQGGGRDLTALLPTPLQNTAAAVGGLSLTSVGLTLTGGVTPTAVSAAYATVGLPGESWQPVPGFQIGGLSAEFCVTDPFDSANRAAEVTVRGAIAIGDTAFDVYAEAPDFTLGVDLQDDAVLPLRQLFSTYLPTLPAPPDLTVSEFQAAATAKEGFSLSACMADAPGWSFDLGPTGLTVEGVRVDAVHRTAVGPNAIPPAPPGAPGAMAPPPMPSTDVWMADVTGSDQDTQAPDDVISGPEVVGTQGCLSGCLIIGDLELDAGWVIPGELSLRADLPSARVSDLVGWLDQLGLTVPQIFDIELTGAYLVIEADTAGASLTVGCDVAGLGLVALTARKSGGGTGLAIGADLDVAALAAIPGLQALSAIDGFLGLQQFAIVASSLADPGFTFPDLANLGVPALAGRSITRPAGVQGVQRGLTVYAELAAAKSAGLRALATYLHVPLTGTAAVVVAVSMPDPGLNTTASVSVDVPLNGVTHLVGSIGVFYRRPDVGAFLAGTLTTSVQGRPLTFTVTAAILENGVLISGSMAGTLTFGPVSLTDLGVVIGLDLEGVPSFGVCGALAAGSFASSVAVFLDSVDPAKSLLAGSVTELTLADVAEFIAGQSGQPGQPTAALPVLGQIGVAPLSTFTLPASAQAALASRDLTALAAAFATQSVTIPSAADQVHLIGSPDGVDWHLTDLTTMTHYSLVTGPGGVAGSIDPQLYLAPQQTMIGAITFPQGMRVRGRVDLYVTAAALDVGIEPGQGILAEVQLDPVTVGGSDVFALTAADGGGGPLFSVCTYTRPGQSDPRLRSPHVLVSGKLTVFGLVVADAYLDVSTSGLECTLDLSPVPGVQVALSVTVAGPTAMSIGGGVQVGVNTTLDFGALGSLPIDVSVGGSVSGGVRDTTVSLSFSGAFTFEGLSLSVGPLTLDIDATAFSNLPREVLAAVRAALLNVLGAPAQWLAWVRRGVLTGIADVTAAARVLVSQFAQTAAQIGQLLHDAGYAAGEVATAMTAIGADATTVLTTLKNAFGLGADDAAAAAKAAGVAAADMAAALKSVFGWSAGQVANYLKSSYGLASGAVNSALSSAGYAAADVTSALGSAFADAGSALDGVGSTIAGGATDVGNTIGDGLGSIF
ncbi:MAG: hypothetical protein HOW97_11795 [Catenulispora sp.]|nr:hypothetical protein [Catenulispora sp.]